ncbi:MAG: glycosyltransferase family 4 protein [Gemmatimonadetes bacterium]|nr:glycosyltransferase family 4 protein [Gemmatimonadota bacterium]
MHVLQVGPIPPPFGGVQVHLMALRRHLRDAGDRCSAVNNTRHRQPDHDDLYFPASAAGLIARFAALRPDIVHLHLGGDLKRKDLALCLACTEWPMARAVLTFHSGGFPSSPAGRAASPDSLAGRVVRRFDAVIAVNEAIADVFRRYGCAPSRVTVIEPHAEPDVQGVAAAAWPARFQAFARAHDPVLLTVGLLEPEYGLDLQVAALEQVRAAGRNAGLIIVGSGSLEGALRALIAQSPVGEHVLLAGDVPHPETLAAIARCDLLQRPTAYDGDSVSVREALALGTPVAATDTGMRPAGVRLLRARTAEAIAEAALEHAGRRDAARGPAGGDMANLARVRELYGRLLAR